LCANKKKKRVVKTETTGLGNSTHPPCGREGGARTGDRAVRGRTGADRHAHAHAHAHWGGLVERAHAERGVVREEDRARLGLVPDRVGGEALEQAEVAGAGEVREAEDGDKVVPEDGDGCVRRC
jgi:hypothetical protein